MSDDNVVSFPGVEVVGNQEEPNNANDVLKAAMNRYDDVIIIGINKKGGQCISSVPLKDAIFELSRAIHRIHDYTE